MMIDKVENRLKMSLSVQSHPVSQLAHDIQDKYLIGLGAVLSKVSAGDSTMKAMYDRWCLSISGRTYDAFFPHRQHAKDAMSWNLTGVRIYRLTYKFLFDCFYLVELFDPEMTDDVYHYLHDCICGPTTTEALQNVRSLFMEGTPHPLIPQELMAHREANRRFLKSPARKVLVVANMSAGKSTLINALTGCNINATANTACTSRVKYIFNKPMEDGFTLWDDKVFSHHNDVDEVRNSECDVVAFHFHSTLKDENICFVDTPGVNNSKDTSHGDITYDAIKRDDYDLLLFVADGRFPGTTDEESLLKYIASTTTAPVLVAVNQMDTYNPHQDSIEEVLKNYDDILEKAGITNAKVLPTSGWLALLDKLPDETQDMLEVGMERMYKERFKDDFYDLQRYVTHLSAGSVIDRTGIPFLEQMIGLTINNRNKK